MKKTILCICFLFLNLFFLTIIDFKLKYEPEETINYPKNSYQVGNLKILGTDFNKNIVQTDNNEFFLFHDEFGNKSNLGSIFLDYRNKITDRKLIIYGHNSKTLDAPFHFLEKYLNYNYAKKYSTLILETNTKTFKYKLFSVMITTNDFQHINLNFDRVGYTNHLNWLKNNSMYNFNIELESNSEILIFQTCYYNPKNSYLLISWKKV